MTQSPAGNQTSFNEDILSILAHADNLRNRIAVALAAAEPATAHALESLRPNVTTFLGLLEPRIDSLAKPGGSASTAADLVEAAAELQSSALEFQELWSRTSSRDQTLLPALADLLRLADAIVESAARIAIPWKLYERLQKMNSGAILPFDIVVKEWVTNDQIRERLWQQLLQFRFIVPNGLADRSTRLIFKCSTRLGRRLASIVVLAALACAGSWFFLTDPFGSLKSYLLYAGWKINPWYWWVLAGAGLQAAVKAMGENGSQGFPPFSEIRDWAHVKEVSIGISILGSMAAAIALSYSSPDKVNVLSAVSTGYALDHLIKVLASRAPAIFGNSPEIAFFKKRAGL